MLESARIDKLRILVVASEVAPFARTGGMGDVLGALPGHLAKFGHDVKVVVPYYESTIMHGVLPIADIDFPIEIAGRTHHCRVSHIRDHQANISFYFVANDQLFGRKGLYLNPTTGIDFEDNDIRFIFFSLAALEIARRQEWPPHIAHVHDWQSALIPAYLRTKYSADPVLAKTKSVLTIHNLGYQGIFPAERFSNLSLPESMFYAMTGAFEFYGKVNFLKGGIATADWITTVSERYAQEIQSGPEFGCGLEGVLQERTSRVTGILNGVDYATWSPSRDKNIPVQYSYTNLSGKRHNKIEFLRSIGLPMRESAPLIGMISRLTDQKGWELVAEAADRLFAMDIQMVVLGNGEKKYESLLGDLEKKYPDKVKAFFTFDDPLAHQIESASDLFLMPSQWEPCGLNQLYSLKYGTVPIVREVGGLADTVIPYDEATGEGTGFLFKEYSPDSMLSAIEQAVGLYAKRRPWGMLRKAGMNQDFSWDSSAQKYSNLFDRVSSL